MGKISNEERKNLIGEYLSGKSITELSKSYGVTRQAVSKILKSEKSLQKVTGELFDNHDRVIMEWTAFWKSKSGIGQEIADKAFALLKEKIEKASARDIMAIVKELRGLFEDDVQVTDTPIQVNISIEDCSGEKGNDTGPETV